MRIWAVHGSFSVGREEVERIRAVHGVSFIVSCEEGMRKTAGVDKGARNDGCVQELRSFGSWSWSSKARKAMLKLT